MDDSSKSKNVVEAVAGLVKAVPVYQDAVQPAAKELGQAIQPAAKEIGKAVHTVTRSVNLILAPLSVLVWGYDQVREFVETKVAERLNKVPPEDLITPKPNVAVPAMDALRYTGHESTLSDLYANLLAASMDKSTAHGAHPAFVEIIKQLTPDEAKIISLFVTEVPLPLINLRWEFKPNQDGKTGGQEVLVNYSHLGIQACCEFPNMTSSYINNLCRLGLAEVPTFWQYTNKGVYDALENDPLVLSHKNAIEANPEIQPVLEKKGLRVSELGKQFASVCVVQKQ
jgi:hypothetical protein